MMSSLRLGRMLSLGMAVGLISLGVAVPRASAQVHGIFVDYGAVWPDECLILKAANRPFACVRATIGRHWRNGGFDLAWESLRASGMIRGAVHTADPSWDPVDQARHFVNTVKPRSGDLMLILSLDHISHWSPGPGRAWIKAFVDQVKAMTGRPVIIATDLNLWAFLLGNPTDNLGCPLWINDDYRYPGLPWPLLPAAWRSWTFWSYSPRGLFPVPALKGRANFDPILFNGSLADLKALRYP